MTTESSILVSFSERPEHRALVLDIESAAARAKKADPGDRLEIARFEALCARLELLAVTERSMGADAVDCGELPEGEGLGLYHEHPGNPLCLVDGGLLARLSPDLVLLVRKWAGEGRLTVELRMPLEYGRTDPAATRSSAPEPAERWESEDGAKGRQAVEQRFRAQLQAVLATPASPDRSAAVSPSGVHNRVITEVLREFVIGDKSVRVDAPVLYRDGSQASAPFPLRCLALVEEAPAGSDLELGLALLSIRHTEMDPVIDGAWLRNAEVSRPRPAAQTDDFVYQSSLKQLEELTRGGQKSLMLRIYQTGLDAAIVGFYRATVMHLLRYPRSLAVVPMFYSGGQSSADHEGVTTSVAGFVAGASWAVAQDGDHA